MAVLNHSESGGNCLQSIQPSRTGSVNLTTVSVPAVRMLMRTLPTFSTVRRRQHFGLGPAAIGLLSSPPRRPTSYVMLRTPLALNAASYSAVMPPLQIYSSHRRPWNSSLSFLFLLFHSSSPSSSSSGLFVPLRVPRSSRVGFDILVVRRTLRPFFNFFAVIVERHSISNWAAFWPWSNDNNPDRNVAPSEQSS